MSFLQILKFVYMIHLALVVSNIFANKHNLDDEEAKLTM